jgi:hypothetical protein
MRCSKFNRAFLGVVSLVLLCAGAQAAPPCHGTIFIHPNIIKPSDPSSLLGANYAGRETRRMFDRRVEKWTEAEAFLFDARFKRGRAIEFQVNSEFGSVEAAQAEAEKYGKVIGQLPAVLRSRLATVSIHRGQKRFGGGNKNVLIHTGQAKLYEKDGILEEALVHEAAHTSLDPKHASAKDWLKAQRADPEYISKYAQENPKREDIAESFLPYLAIRYRADRISEKLADKIKQAIPKRIEYFDAQSLDVYPIVTERDEPRKQKSSNGKD